MRIRVLLTTSLLLVPILLLVSTTAAAQMSDKEKQEMEAERRQQLEHKTYVLVDEIASGALSLKLPENRVFVLTAAADLVWEHDEPRARNIFWDALNTLSLLNNPGKTIPKSDEGTKTTKPTAKDREQVLGRYFAVYAMRRELMSKVARRDPTLALDMLRSSRQLPVDPIYASFPLPDEHDLEQQIASEAAARDPERALQLARESLAKGLSFELLNLLDRLNEKSGEAGTKFALDIIEKLRTRNLASDPYASRLAISLLGYSRVPKEAPDTKMPRPKLRPLKLEQEQRRELVELITNAALTGSANTNLLFSVEEVRPEIEEFAPERISLLQRKLTAFNQTLNKEQKLSLEYNSIFRSGTPEDMIKLASKAGDDREWMQQQAIVLAVMRGRGDSLREFINTEVEDGSRRKSLLDTLDAEQIGLAANKGDSEGLRKLLPNIRLKEQRALAMAEIAIVMEKKGNHDEALKLLDDAQTMIKTDLNSETQTNALLGLVTAYALVEPAKAFSIIERTIDRANDEIAKALLLDKIVSSGAIKKGEIRLQQSGMIPLDFAVFKYGKSVAALAKVDFDRTKAAADRFERNELRLLARLLLAQALLRSDDQPVKEGQQ